MLLTYNILIYIIAHYDKFVNTKSHFFATLSFTKNDTKKKATMSFMTALTLNPVGSKLKYTNKSYDNIQQIFILILINQPVQFCNHNAYIITANIVFPQ